MHHDPVGSSGDGSRHRVFEARRIRSKEPAGISWDGTTMITQQTAEVLSYRKLGDEYHLLTIVAPEIAESARPGQFVNLRPPADRSFILRRPFSIYRVNRRGDWAATIEVVFDVRGGGTSAL